MALATTFKIEIEDESLVWTDVTLYVESMTDGTTSDSQIISTVSITFGIDADEELPILPLLDANVNPSRARIRITENTTTKYYLMENPTGSVQCYPFPSIGGRAYCGRITDFPLANYVNTDAIPMSALVQQLCVETIAAQEGTAIPILWSATSNPTIPAKRIEFNRADRLGTIRDLAASCGARVRANETGEGFEVYDVPRKALSDPSTLTFANALTLNYSEVRIDKPLNAVRVKGAQYSYSAENNYTLVVACQPDSIEADGVTTTTAIAQVLTPNGVPIQHRSIVDEPITGTSNTSIPVTACWSADVVWINDGTQETPVKGASVAITTFDASTITVPDNGTDLFIVTYTQSTVVSWDIENFADNIDGEAQTSTGPLEVVTTNTIGSVVGVWRTTDSRRTGVNYYTGGSFTGSTITLGISPGATGQLLLVDYVKFNATPLTGLNISPATSLLNENGIAESTVGSGTDIGVGMIVAKVDAYDLQAFANLSLTGSEIWRLVLSASPGVIRTTITGQPQTTTYTNEVQTVLSDGGGEYVNTNNAISYVQRIVDPLFPLVSYVPNGWTTTAGIGKVYIAGNPIVAGTTVLVTYVGFQDVSEAANTSVLTAEVFQQDDTPVTDGTSVAFSFATRHDLGCTFSSTSATTFDGVASVELTSSDQTGTVTVVAISGGERTSVPILITDTGEPPSSTVVNIYLNSNGDTVNVSGTGGGLVDGQGWYSGSGSGANGTVAGGGGGGGWLPSSGSGTQPGGNVQYDANGNPVSVDASGNVTFLNPDGTILGDGSRPQSEYSGSTGIARPEGEAVPGEICRSYPNDQETTLSGFVRGSRRLVGCEGEPLAHKLLIFDNLLTATDAAGIFTFSTARVGQNIITVDGRDYTFTISPDGSSDRGGWRVVCYDTNGDITYTGPAE